MSREVKTYCQSIEDAFSFFKATEALDDLMAKSIRFTGPDGFLIPLANIHKNDAKLIQQLMNWREANSFAFPTQFPVSFEGTARWVSERVLAVKDRLLFLVVDAHGNRIGHLGLAGGLNADMSIEIDNVVRGDKAAVPGIMSGAMRALLKWTEEFISPKQIYLRVFQDNEHAIAFYKKMGFVESEVIPLRKHQSGATLSYSAVQPADISVPDKHFLKMSYRPKRAGIGTEMILTAGPSVSKREISYVLDAAQNGWNQGWNGYLQKLEKAFAAYIGVKHALCTSSCTGALHIALQALGIGPGDEVIVPDITWVATANAVVYVGATPVFADVNPHTWCLDPISFAKAITPKTKAVIPVHLYGHPAPMHEIVPIARKHNLYIIEDAAPAIGAECGGQKVGCFGDFAAFSFQGAKLAVTGEGGMLVTNDEKLYAKAYAIWDQGRVPGTFWINQNGLKYKMSNLQAAFGLGQVEQVERLIEAKRRIFSWYAENLQGCPHVKLNYEMDWARSIYWMTSILVADDSPVDRDQLQKFLKAARIDTRPVFPAISQYPHWPQKQEPQKIALHLGQHAINLPSGVCLTREHVEYICNAIKTALGAPTKDEAHINRYAVL